MNLLNCQQLSLTLWLKKLKVGPEGIEPSTKRADLRVLIGPIFSILRF